MILAVIQAPTENAPTLYQIPGDWPEYRRATFSPDARRLAAVNTALSAKHRDRTGLHWEARAKLAELAEMQNIPGLSWAELATIQAAAEKLARRAGLVREAKENGIV